MVAQRHPEDEQNVNHWDFYFLSNQQFLLLWMFSQIMEIIWALFCFSQA